MAQYTVELIAVGDQNAKNTRWRTGRLFERKHPQILDLTKEEVEEFKNDRFFKIRKATDKDVEAREAASSEEAARNAGPEPEADAEAEAEGAEDKGATSEEETGDKIEENSAEPLARSNSRDELNAQAKELGIKAPEKLETKLHVAQAIVEAQAQAEGAENEE